MRSKKTYIILIAIVLIFFVIMFLVFGLDGLKEEGYDTTIILGDDTVWIYKNKTWFNLSDYKDINWKKYDVYLNNEKKGNYYLMYNSSWYAFDNKKNAVTLDGDLLAVNANHNVSVSSFETSKIDDYTYVYEVLKENSLSTTSEYTADYKILFDYDSDGIEEEFYVITNAFPMDFDPEKIFSMVFMVKNDTVYPIYTDVTSNTGFNGCKPYINTFIDINGDSKYEFILSCARYSVSTTNNMLYKYTDNEFKVLISNNK